MIAFALALAVQSDALDMYNVAGMYAQPRLTSSELLCVVNIPGPWTDSNRTGIQPTGTLIPVAVTQASIRTATQELGSNRLLVALKGNGGSEATRLQGTYLAYVAKPNAHGQMYGSMIAHPTDLFVLYALRLANDKFRFKDQEGPTLTFYRALSLTWDQMSLSQLRTALTSMPSLAPEDLKPGYEDFTPDAHAVFNLAAKLEPVRRLVVLGELKRFRFRAVEKPFEQALWAARDNPEIEQVQSEYALFDDGLRRPQDLRLTPDELIAKAEQCTQDTRAMYLRTFLYMKFDTRRLAAMLVDSGPKAMYEIVKQLGLQSNDTSLFIHTAPPEKREAELKRLVAYWKQKYGMSG